ncbi:rho GTPase-activating protein 12-like isoform X2 [Watersipora subatra]|uniref:rho GTPase-activating protein 12-like isoform X2 n=1 Tax=Watersipora subatra TaxID=2589382 RepID=UPI00355C1797
MAADCVEVLFDYEYDMSDGKHIAISKGDIYTLLAKSTEEWWKVRKDDHKKFYVPATYVKEIHQDTASTTPVLQNDYISVHSDIPVVPTNGHHRTASANSTGSDSYLDSQSCDSSLDSKGESSDQVSSLPRNSTLFTPPNNVSQLDSHMENLQLTPLIVTPDAPSSPEEGEDDSVMYANMEIIQEIIAQRKENSEQLSDPSQSENWEMHTDDSTGRVYYFNSATQETTWDSPVIKRRPKFNQKEIMALPDSKRLSRVTSFRKGWTERISEDGSRIYVHNATGDKWHMATDSSGKEYYYNAKSQESLWELPEMSGTRRVLSTFANTERVSQSLAKSNLTHYPSKEEPARRVAPPVPLSRRASVDVLSSRRIVVNKTFTLPAKLTQSRPDNPEDSADGGLTLRNATQSSSNLDTQKKGYLHRAKYTETRKKVKKTWSQAYVVAYDNNLLIYRDEKAAASKPDAEFGKPEAIIDLTHALVGWSSKDKSARRNVLEVTSASGTCYLFQHDDNILMHQWHTVILGKVKKFNPSAIDSPDSINVPENESNNNNDAKTNGLAKRKLHSRRFSKYGSKSVYTLYEDNAEFQEPVSVGVAGEINKVGIREKLRKLLARRPTLEDLEKQGILQTENVFGSRLQFICDRESTTVPKFVVRCIKTIERKGLTFDGLYRISGNQAQIQKLRFLVDSTDSYNLADYDVNVLTGALKLFFRELKEPLIPFELYDTLSTTIRDQDQTKKARTMKLQLSTMPTVNLDTLKFLFAHLVRVLEHGAENRMKSQSLAIVFGPTLMWPEKESSAIAVNMMCQNSIVEYILSRFDKLF